MHQLNKTRSAMAAIALGACLSACAATGGADDPLKPFPPARDGFVRHVIELPQRADEPGQRVELIAGKTMEVDCNQHSLGGQWQEKVVAGWGYSFYEIEKVGPGRSTLMACPPASTREAFVPVGGEPLLVRYNSALPLVIYVPAGLEVRYRLWSASVMSHPAPQR